MIKHNGYLLIRIECDWEEFYMWRGNELNYTYGKNSEHTDSGIMELPPGNYQIIGLAKDLTEEQWKGIVDEEWFADESVMYVDYNDDDLFFKTATESGRSLLKSHSLEPNQTLILKEVEK